MCRQGRADMTMFVASFHDGRVLVLVVMHSQPRSSLSRLERSWRAAGECGGVRRMAGTYLDHHSWIAEFPAESNGWVATLVRVSVLSVPNASCASCASHASTCPLGLEDMQSVDFAVGSSPSLSDVCTCEWWVVVVVVIS